MVPLTRRQLLALSTASIGAFAGCMVPASESINGTLGGISLVNTLSTAIEFDIIVESGGDIVYWESHGVGPASGDGQTNTETVVPDLPDSPGSIVVHGRVDGQRRTIDLGRDSLDSKCVLPSFVYQKYEDGFGTTVNIVENLPDPPEEVSCEG